MRIRTRIIGLFATLALVLPMTAGLVFAQPAENEEVLSEEITAVDAEVEEALLAYMESEVSVSHAPKYIFAGRRHLEGKERIVYDFLLEKILSVAKGELTNTEFQISAKDLGLDGRYTAADLGVASVVSGSSISDAARDAMEAKLSAVDSGRVITALLYDCPLDLYWYDKEKGTGITIANAIGGTWNSEKGEYELYFTEDAKVCYRSNVAGEYAAGTYELDAAKMDAVQAAIEKAKAIVSANADRTDLEKLTAYKNAICDNVSYNTKASTGGTAYGNPWQLIWVFDDDSSTNVVCEGYAKAFQFLCDSSSFQSAKVESRLVSGKMQGGTGAGEHMWNLVTMKDGKNYLVDVTNSDTGTIGSSGSLFLAGLNSGEMTDLTKPFTVGPLQYSYDKETIGNYSEEELKVASGKYDDSVIEEPETPSVEPETPSTEPETPSVEPETPSTEPETPSTEPETPSTEPETPSTEPETPSTEPETPSVEPETTAAKKSQNLSLSRTVFSKTYGDKPFLIGVKTNGDGSLKYQSSNPKVAAVDANGKVTIMGAGTAVISVYGAESAAYAKSATARITVQVKKAANPLKASGKTVKLSKAKVKKKAQTIKKDKAFTVKGAAGSYTFKKKNGNGKIQVASNGKITVKKGLKKGTYKVKVVVTAKGNANYAKGSKTITVKIQIK